MKKIKVLLGKPERPLCFLEKKLRTSLSVRTLCFFKEKIKAAFLKAEVFYKQSLTGE